MMANEERRIAASSSALELRERFDRLIHALAQLPDGVSLEIWGDGPARGQVTDLAVAYGIADRLEFVSSKPRAYAAVVYPSADNEREAPLRPDAGPHLVLDPERHTPSGSHVVRTMGELIHALSRPGDPAGCSQRSAECLRGQRIAVVTSIPTHTRIPLFNQIADRLGRVDAALRVIFLAANRADRERWMRLPELRFDHEFARPGVPFVRELGRRVPLDLIRRLRRFDPTVVVSGGMSLPVSGRVALYARRRRIPFGVWSGETTTTSQRRPAMRKLGRRRIASAASFGLSYGFGSDEYLHMLNPSLPTIYGRNTTVLPVRRAHPHDSTVKLLAVGRLEPGKATDTLVASLSRLPKLDCSLTIIGDGEDLPRLREQASTDPRVRLLGAVASDVTLAHFQHADVFLFPSRIDVFGLAVVEAMGSGVATIVNRAAGVTDDLADSSNAVIIDGTDPEDWANAIERLVLDDTLRAQLGEAARRTVAARWTLDHSVDAYIAGMRLATRLAPRQVQR